MQMIAEKSVNCSMISLPRIVTDRKLPFCGPLEGLALMYVLREQVSKVTLLGNRLGFMLDYVRIHYVPGWGHTKITDLAETLPNEYLEPI